MTLADHIDMMEKQEADRNKDKYKLILTFMNELLNTESVSLCSIMPISYYLILKNKVYNKKIIDKYSIQINEKIKNVNIDIDTEKEFYDTEDYMYTLILIRKLLKEIRYELKLIKKHGSNYYVIKYIKI